MQPTEHHPHKDHLPEGFHMTELGPLPTEWRVVRLGEAASLERGLSWSKSDERAEGIGVVKIPDILDCGKINFSPQVHLSKKIGEKKLLEKDDILLVGSSGAVKNVGRAAILEVEPIYPLTFASFTVRLRTRPNIMVPQFAFYLIQSQWVDFSVFSKRAADGKYNLQLKQLEGARIPLPPLDEQQAIAQVLRTVQQAQEATDKVIDALHTLKQSLMRHLFTYGAVPVDQASQGSLQETELGAIPAHWQVMRLGTLFDILQGKSVSARRNKGVRPRPFLRTSNVYWGQIDLSKVDVMDFTEEEEKKYALRCGDLLVCEGGEVGRAAVWEGQVQGIYYQNHIHRLRAKNNNICPYFVTYWLQTAFTLLQLYSGVSNKTTIPNLSRGRLANFSIPLPPLAEQQAIAQILRAVDAKIAAERAYRAALDALFRTLLHQLMTGQIRVVGAMPASDADKE